MQFGNSYQIGNIDYGLLIDSNFKVCNYVVLADEIKHVAEGVVFSCDDLEVYGYYCIDGKVVVFGTPWIYGSLVVNGIVEVR